MLPIGSIFFLLRVAPICSCYIRWFKRRYNYKKHDGRADRRQTNFGTKLIYPIFLTKKRVYLQGLYATERIYQSMNIKVDMSCL